jgi:hypothetical protein
MCVFVGVYFVVFVCHGIPSPFFYSGSYEMDDKKNLTAATKFTVPNHGGWDEYGIIMLNNYKLYSKFP